MDTSGTNVVGVQFRRAGKIYDFSSSEHDLSVGDKVVVETDKGTALGQVAIIRYERERAKSGARPLKPVLRRASKKELDRPPRLTSEEVSSFTKEQVESLKLNMKVLKSEVQFGGSKVIVFFTAPGRVDFRELVKKLAGGLKTRVELKQVGARDETKLLGGVGICGREYCCSSFLREFVPVSIKMAKNQNLALNPSKVSGGCGRLLCCLTYENDTYSKLRKALPPRGAKVMILESGVTGDVIKTDLLNQLAIVEDESGRQEQYKLEALKVVDRSQAKSEEPAEETEWGDDIDLEALEDFSQGGAKAENGDQSQRNKKRSPRNNNNRSQKPRPKQPSGDKPSRPKEKGAGDEKSGEGQARKPSRNRRNNRKAQKSQGAKGSQPKAKAKGPSSGPKNGGS